MTRERSASPFDPLAMIEVLNRHNVAFLVIGGIAAGVQGAMWATFDLDITYSRTRVNLKRLAAALAELGASPIALEDGVQVHLDERGLRSGDIWTLATRHGRLDLLAEPAPGLRYESLEPRARTIEGEQRYPVASIADLIAMKRVAGRPQDAGHIRLLRAAWEASTEPNHEAAGSGVTRGRPRYGTNGSRGAPAGSSRGPARRHRGAGLPGGDAR